MAFRKSMVLMQILPENSAESSAKSFTDKVHKFFVIQSAPPNSPTGLLHSFSNQSGNEITDLNPSSIYFGQFLASRILAVGGLARGSRGPSGPEPRKSPKGRPAKKSEAAILAGRTLFDSGASQRRRPGTPFRTLFRLFQGSGLFRALSGPRPLCQAAAGSQVYETPKLPTSCLLTGGGSRNSSGYCLSTLAQESLLRQFSGCRKCGCNTWGLRGVCHPFLEIG